MPIVRSYCDDVMGRKTTIVVMMASECPCACVAFFFSVLFLVLGYRAPLCVMITTANSQSVFRQHDNTNKARRRYETTTARVSGLAAVRRDFSLKSQTKEGPKKLKCAALLPFSVTTRQRRIRVMRESDTAAWDDADPTFNGRRRSIERAVCA